MAISYLVSYDFAMTQKSEQTILIVDNLSPYTKDIVNCVTKLGVKFAVKSSYSLANAIFSDQGTNHGSVTPLHTNESDNGQLLDSSMVDMPMRLVIDLDGSNSKTSGPGHADKVQNSGRLFIDKVILSGRRANDPKINATNSHIIKECLRLDVPLLGICYGAEILALTLGGTIKKMDRGIQENIPITVSKSSSLISSDAKPVFYESHKYYVSRLPEGFESLASSMYCEHEIFCFKRLYGTQFHPEKSGIDGLKLLSNFIGM
jgi:GMP synthase (glutamine-hydrolysing)